MLETTFDQRLAQKYQSLSRRLKEAGDFIAANPLQIATRSVRSVAQEAGLSPATFSRLARELGYDSFEQVRDVMRSKISKRVDSFADRADRLWHDQEAGKLDFLQRHRQACQENIAALSTDVDADRLKLVVDKLHAARKVAVLGALGSAGIAEYMLYTANFLSAKWSLLDGSGVSLGSGLAELQKGDALVIVTKPPFARKALLAAAAAQKSGVFVTVITDSHTCPALRHADVGLLVRTDSPHFYSSYVTTIFLVETIIGMLAARQGPAAKKRIAEVEQRNRDMEEVTDG